MKKRGKKNLNRELEMLSQELRERVRNSGRRAFRMRVWYLTVNASYFIKRTFDMLMAFTLLLLLTPFMLLVALLIRATSPGAAIFSQIRVGRFGRHFRFYKFRSMYVGASGRKEELLSRNQSADGVIFKLKSDPRVTPLGRFLRKTSIDELPQLFCVLLGNMSLVGPRPPLPEEVRQYTLEDRKRLNVIPGLTCLWQIRGRSDIPFSQQVKLDKEYIRSQSIWNDLVILLKTVPAIISGRGAY